MKKLLPVVLAIIGIGCGIGAGLALRPQPQEVVEINPCGPEDLHAAPAADDHGGGHDDHGATGPEYVKINNQFVVPIVTHERVSAMVVMSLSLEVDAGSREAVYTREPKLRDEFLQVMFDHANLGGFRGAFTDSNTLDILRRDLLQAAQNVMGKSIKDVLIVELARQDA